MSGGKMCGAGPNVGKSPIGTSESSNQMVPQG